MFMEIEHVLNHHQSALSFVMLKWCMASIHKTYSGPTEEKSANCALETLSEVKFCATVDQVALISVSPWKQRMTGYRPK
jgi:hypothetical protein